MVNTPEPTLLVVQPFDKTLIGDIEKAIMSADLGLNPANDGNVIRVPIPPLNEERRKEYVKVLHKMAEEGRVSVRHAEPERWTVEIEGAAKSAALLLTESFAEGWQATVDGEPVPAKPVAGRFLGVPVPEGRSVVTLSYHEPSLGLGAAISGLALIAFALSGWRWGRRRPHPLRPLR